MSLYPVPCSAPNWILYFFWRKGAYNNAVALVAFANYSECVLLSFMFVISRLFGVISGRTLEGRLVLKSFWLASYFETSCWTIMRR